MRIKNRYGFEQPQVMIIPMIDIIFFLLVFFMLGTLYMVNVKSVPVNMPQAESAVTQLKVSCLISIKKDGSLWLEDVPVEEAELIAFLQKEKQSNEDFSVIIKADESLDYGYVVSLMDKLRLAGISHFGLATRSGG